MKDRAEIVVEICDILNKYGLHVWETYGILETVKLVIFKVGNKK